MTAMTAPLPDPVIRPAHTLTRIQWAMWHWVDIGVEGGIRKMRAIYARTPSEARIAWDEYATFKRLWRGGE